MWISEFQTKAASGDWLYRRHYPSSRFWISSGAGQWSLIIFVLRFGVVLWDRKCLLWFFLAIWILIVITLTIVSNWHLYIFYFWNINVRCELLQNVLQKVAEEVDELLQMAIGEGLEKIQASTRIMEIAPFCHVQPCSSIKI